MFLKPRIAERRVPKRVNNLTDYKSKFDTLGSYTGNDLSHDKPVQDADDL